jgi:hypothetical protein
MNAAITAEANGRLSAMSPTNTRNGSQLYRTRWAMIDVRLR